MPRRSHARAALFVASFTLAVLSVHGVCAAATRGGPLGVPLPLFPSDNWWNVDVSQAPVDPQSATFIAFVNNGGTRRLHPDFGTYADPGPPPSAQIYGIPYVVVNGNTQPKRAVEFYYPDESDGVNHSTGLSYPFYPIPDEAITQPHWIEGGEPGNQNPGGDRHMLIVDKDNNHLYELFDLHWDGTKWTGGSGAFFDMNVNGRRPEGWTSADAAGLAILPGLVRYDEVYGNLDPIRHALRVTVRTTNDRVYPASHSAGSTTGALPMGARLRLKASVDVTRLTTDVHLRRVFQAMKTYGLVVADNGSDMYIGGTFDPGWDNDILNPAFANLTASDFEVIQLGYRAPGASGRVWYLRNSTTPGFPDIAASYGAPGDIPVVGDWNGDGVGTIGVYRPSQGAWYLRNSNTPGSPDIAVSYGGSGDFPVVGDWNGDGVDTIGVYRPSQGAWYLRNSNTPGSPDIAMSYGAAGSDIPVVGDWDGDGVDTIGVYRKSQGAWYLRNSNTPGFPDIALSYGAAGSDVPVVGDWDGDGVDTAGVYRPSRGAWYLRNSLTPGFPDIALSYGSSGDIPVVGDWNSDGIETMGVSRLF